MKMRIFLISCALFFYSLRICGQTTVTVFSESFSHTSGEPWVTSGRIGDTAFYVSRSGNDWAAKRNDSDRLSLTNDTGTIANAAGWVYAYASAADFESPYSTTLSQNHGLVTWYVNLRQSILDPEGFGASNWGMAFILACQGTLKSEMSGYALLLGSGSTTDPLRLAKFTTGFNQIASIIVSNTTGLTDFGTQYLSAKVTYDPGTNRWELFVRNDGTSAFVDPLSGTLVSQGTAIDNTYTSTSLPYMGAYWQGSTDANKYAYFDNVTVQVQDNTLPVELSAFTVTPDHQNHPRLTWVTQSETGVVGFHVLRAEDKDLSVAHTVSPLIPAANTAQQQTYTYTDVDLHTTGLYYYWLQSSDLDGSSAFHGPLSFYFDSSGNGSAPEIPLQTSLGPIYPNPFNPIAFIPFYLATPAEVEIQVYDSRGQLVRRLDLGVQQSGAQRLNWDGKDGQGRDLGSGIYCVTLHAGKDSLRCKAMLLK